MKKHDNYKYFEKDNIKCDYMISTTKLSKGYQTVVPSEIRKKLDIKPDDLIKWEIVNDNEVKVKFEKKITLEDVAGFISSDKKTNSVKLKKRIQRGDDKF